MAMILATLAGFAGIICSFMFSSFVQIQGQKIELGRAYLDWYIQHPEQVNVTQFNETMESYQTNQNFTLNASVYLLYLGIALFIGSLVFACIGFVKDDELKYLEIIN